MIKLLKSLPRQGYKIAPLILIGLTILLWFVDSAVAADCKTMAEYQKEYKDCYACQTIKFMLEAFMMAAGRTYDISKEAGIILLTIGSFLWVPFFVIGKISSFTNPEGPKMVNEFLIFLFKIAVAYVAINAGISVLVDYFINPFLAAGADMGTAYLSFGLPTPDNVEGMTHSYRFEGNGAEAIIDPAVINKILDFAEGVSIKVSNNMVIGNALMCHSLDAFKLILGLRMIDLWLWLCGAIIWVIGFLLALFICYYLLDICFKIGFAIIMLPIAIGLWPFKATQGRVGTCFSIILRSSAIYAMLAVCVTLATILIDEVLKVDELFLYIEKDNIKAIDKKFSLFSKEFLLLCVGFLYAIKLIGKNETLVNKLFPDKIFGSMSPIHGKLTSATAMVHNKAMKPFGLARDIATHQTGRAIRGVGKGIGKVGGALGGMAAGAAKNYALKKYDAKKAETALKKASKNK